MPLRSPDFWQKEDNFFSKLLSPLGRVYASVLHWKLKKAKPYRAKIPVVCVGNLIMGGVGKTPLAMSIGEYFKMRGLRPVFLTRGYGGGLSNILVDLTKHTPKETGDEALLLARVAPTIVDSDRVRGAKMAEKIGADVIIMDDGFQNPQLVKDLSFAVFDGRYGFGNGKVFPAGPLREPVEEGLKRADAFIVVGHDKAGIKEWVSKRFDKLFCIGTHIEQDVAKTTQLSGKKILAFAGIGFPDKFFDMLRQYGCEVVDTQAFSDHYPYTDEDMTDLIARANRQEAVLVTTAKDGVRIDARFLPHIHIVDAYMVWDTPDIMRELLTDLHKK